MSIKSANILKKLESMERDLNELQSMRSRISEERSYSSIIQTSMEEEIQKLEERKSELLRLTLDCPDSLLSEPKTTSADSMKNLYSTEEKNLNSEITYQRPGKSQEKTKKEKPVFRY